MNQLPGDTPSALIEAIRRVIHDGEDLPVPATREAMLKAIASGSVISWQHINLLGEYDFSE